MKSIKWIAVFLALLVCLSGCAGTHQSGGSYNIYLIAKSSTTEFWKAVFSGANAAKSEYNVQLTILAPDTEEDFEVQNDYIRQAVADGADAIVFSAISYTENAAAIDEAVAAGVRVVVIDSDVDSKGVSVRIGTDNVAAGRMSGETALKTAQKKIVVGIVNAYAETQNCREREQGFREVLLGDSRVKGIYAVNVSTDALEARLAAEKLLREHPEINVLIGTGRGRCPGGGLPGADGSGTRRVLRQQRQLHRAAADRGGGRPGGAEFLRHGVSGRRKGVAGFAGGKIRLCGAHRHRDHHRHQRKYVYHGEPEGHVFFRLIGVLAIFTVS